MRSARQLAARFGQFGKQPFTFMLQAVKIGFSLLECLTRSFEHPLFVDQISPQCAHFSLQ
ncbi:hypothetical protein DLM46_07870 [Paraburkholderia lacunae]|uniref:Uncharacterized protein n=1 Tax=Paraburkholderia lacunae TaxID=2211104 RepID=A0A370NCV1_9BURK|nr:hypothetical protein DLM46_07870 [Paraburkholderia lacunae]